MSIENVDLKTILISLKYEYKMTPKEYALLNK